MIFIFLGIFIFAFKEILRLSISGKDARLTQTLAFFVLMPADKSLAVMAVVIYFRVFPADLYADIQRLPLVFLNLIHQFPGVLFYKAHLSLRNHADSSHPHHDKHEYIKKHCKIKPKTCFCDFNWARNIGARILMA